MVCNACGAEVSDEVNFCPQCGAAVKADVPVAVQHIEVEKVSEPLSDLSKICAVDDVVKKVFPYLDRARSIMSQRNNIPYEMGCLKQVLFWGITCPITVVGVIYLANWVNIILLIIVAFFLLVWGYYKIEWKINNHHTQQLMKQANAEQEIACEILRQNADIVAYLPSKYLIPEATSYIREMFETRRVRTLNEALDKYDEYAHRMAMENAQSTMLARQESIDAAIRAQTAAIRAQTSAIDSQTNSINWSIRNATDSINTRIR